MSSLPSASSVKAPGSTFTGGEQGWVGLKLESIEEINHNTKKFRFALPNKDDVSGLHVACVLFPFEGSLRDDANYPSPSCLVDKISRPRHGQGVIVFHGLSAVRQLTNL